jgi:hypothetical protein
MSVNKALCRRQLAYFADVANLFYNIFILFEWWRRGTLIVYWWESQRERDH